jgi:outer membrane protein TolC
MPLPLWDRRGDAVQAADARVRAAELITRQLGAQVAADLANRLDALTQLLAQVEQTDTRVIPQLTAAADELRTAYLQGRASYPDLIEVQRTLVAVEQEQNDARRAIVDAMVAIEALTGTTIQEMQHE